MVSDAPEQAAGGGRAERDDGNGLHDRALGLEPDLAALDLIGVRTLVQAPFAAHLVLEMLDRVGDEGVLARNAGLLERLDREYAPPDRRTACRRGLPCRRAAPRPASGASAASFARDRLGCPSRSRSNRPDPRSRRPCPRPGRHREPWWKRRCSLGFWSSREYGEHAARSWSSVRKGRSRSRFGVHLALNLFDRSEGGGGIDRLSGTQRIGDVRGPAHPEQDAVRPGSDR